MAKTRLDTVDLTDGEAVRGTEVEPGVAGSMTVTFIEHEGHMTPQVSFKPLGRINPNTIERFLPFIYREIQRAQVEERRRGNE